MGVLLTHSPSGTVAQLSKEPDLPLNIATDEDQDVIRTAGGIRQIYTRRVKNIYLTLQLKLLNHQDRKLLEQFFDETVNGMAEKFDLEIQTEHEGPLQVGGTINGLPVTVGTVLAADCGNPGGPIQVGEWVKQDRRIYKDVRFNQPKIEFMDETPENFSTTVEFVQENP